MLKINVGGHSIAINSLPGAMDPSPYTEFLFERIVAQDSMPSNAIDIGCGSGALAILLAKSGVENVYAFDINDTALEATRKNAQLNGVFDRIDVQEADITESLDLGFNVGMIVSNPPSLPMRSKPESEYDTFNYYGGKDGRKFIENLIKNCPSALHNGGKLLFVNTSLANISDTIKQLPRFGFHSFTCTVRELPFRESYYEHIDWFRELKQKGIADYAEPNRNNKKIEYLYAISCEFYR